MLRSVKFTTTTNDENILDNIDVQKRICERLGIPTDKYLSLLSGDGIKMDFTLFFSATNKVSVNNGLFDDLIEDSVFTSGGKYMVKSIRIKTPTTASILVDMD